MENSPTTSTEVRQPWKLPLGIILALHIGLALAVTYMPELSKKKPRFDNIYTVDLIQMAPAPPPPLPATPQPVKDVPKEAVSIAQKAPDAPVDIKPISISPKKMKIKKKIVKKPTPPKEDRSKIIAERKRLAELIRQEALADEAEKEALRALDEARTLAADESFSTPTKHTTTSSRAGGSSGSQLTGVEARWFSAVKSHILGFWALPELKLWNPDMVATVVITVDSKGRIIDSFFETPSGDRVFDQFVKKSLQEADPVPAMPAALKKSRFEFGLHFSPNSIN